MRRVLQVITPSHVSGAEIQLVRLIRQLKARGHTVTTLVKRNHSIVAELRRLGLDLEPLPINGKLNLTSLPILARRARQARAELCHSHLSSASWWCGWLQQMGGPPSIGHVHGFTSALWHRHQSHLLAVSQAVKDHLVNQGVPAERITVAHNALDPGDFIPTRSVDAVRGELGADAATPVVGTFAHLSVKKGFRELFEAIPDVLSDCPRAQFWIAGRGPLREELETTARVRGFLANVRFLGFRTDMADLIQAIDVLALPSHREPCALVFVESALLAKPILACRSGGAPESIADGQTGLLVPVGDSRQIASQLLLLLTNREQARKMGLAGRQRALDLFGWNRFLRTLEATYERVLDERIAGTANPRRAA